jgi:hypothetical protein
MYVAYERTTCNYKINLRTLDAEKMRMPFLAKNVSTGYTNMLTSPLTTLPCNGPLSRLAPVPRLVPTPHRATSVAAATSQERASHERQERQERIKHFRKVLLNERKRFEEKRKSSFNELVADVRKFADDEISFIRTLLSRVESQDGRACMEQEAYTGDGQARSHVDR